jgi:hypothetical protein
MVKVDVLEYASLFLFVAKPDDIEAERQYIEAERNEKIAVFEVTHTLLSGTRCTRVTWKVE